MFMYYFITNHKKVKTNKKHPHHKDAFLHIIDTIYKTSNISLALLSGDAFSKTWVIIPS